MIPIGAYTLLLTADHRERIDTVYVTANAQPNIDRRIIIEAFSIFIQMAF